MQRFWNLIIRPLLERVQPARIIEIGAANGINTGQLLGYCQQRQGACELHSIDPVPRYDVEAVLDQNRGIFFPHRQTSLEFLATSPPADIVLLDGDHNWYTVYNELKLISQAAAKTSSLLPIILCHDVGWPYGRRDLYYDPSTIPDHALQPHQRGGLIYGQSLPQLGKGLNAHLVHAAHEGGPYNGVLTAIEEFLDGHNGEIELVILPVLYGLGLLISKERLQNNSGLRELIEYIKSPKGWRQLVDFAERHRIQGDISAQALRKQLERCRTKTVAQEQKQDGYSSALPSEVIANIQQGVLMTSYKGVRFWKSPFDVVIYMQLIQRLRPATIFEIGTLDGGSAVWFADQMQLLGIRPNVISIDKDSQPKLSDHRVNFIKADALDLDDGLADLELDLLPHPWLVVEDSAHTYETTRAALSFFDRCLQRGDYLVVEDGIVRDMPGEQYRRYEDGPCRAAMDFLKTTESNYEVDRSLCNFFGQNYTWNPGAFLVRL